MHDPLLHEAARLLELEPTRTLEADRLYARARRGVPAGLSLDAFIESLRARPAQFTVVANGCDALGDVFWDERERIRYERALLEAGAGAPVIALAEQPNEPFPAPHLPPAAGAAGYGPGTLPRGVPCRSDVAAPAAAADNAAIIHALREAVADIMRAERVDNTMRETAVRAIQELQAVRRALPP